jgi:RNA polymerase sigma factor (sigma-70 family)
LAGCHTAAVMVAERTSRPFHSRGKGVNKVDLDYQQSIQHQFDAYGKKVLKYAARDIYRRLARQAEREISLSEFPEDGTNIIAVFDEYFEEERQFTALGFSVAIKSELLAEALKSLPERQREIIMQYYFLGMSDREISETGNDPRSTVSYKRNAALKKLLEIMEGLRDEK